MHVGRSSSELSRLALLPLWLLAAIVIVGCTEPSPETREVTITGEASSPPTPDAVTQPAKAIATH